MTITNAKYNAILAGMKALKETEDQIGSLREQRERQVELLRKGVKGEKRTPELMEFIGQGFMTMYNCQAVPTPQLSLQFTGKEAAAAQQFYFRTIRKALPVARKAKKSAKKVVSAVERAAKQLEKKLTKAQIKALIAALKAYIA